ncbi:MAG: 4Fe-4S dicluster domain-containing protein [Defluviitaleaceae bacterium]|nr:4Fe-4S dicluster domain-containing protein [Defluviitaleaceae bacterium]
MKLSKRQSIRKGMIIFMCFTFPITIAWLSPAIPVLYGMFLGVVSGAIIIFILQFLVSLFLGRAFCAFLCPGGGINECLMLINQKQLSNKKLRIIKWIIWFPWLTAVIGGFIIYGGISRVDFFAGLANGWEFLFAPYRYAIYFGVLLLVFMLHLIVGKRAFCQTVCWMAPFMIIGTKVSDWLKLPRLSLKANSDGCIGCTLCSKRCPMSLDVKSMVETGNMKNSECILCGECIDICPKKSIFYIFKNASSKQ